MAPPRTLRTPVPELIESPSTVAAAGTKPKLIEEYVGRLNSGEQRLSIARMSSPAGWAEPGQRPEFDEWTLVLDGCLRVEHDGGALDVRAGQAVLVRAGEWVRYSSPEADGATYVAVCLPAFSPAIVHRDEDN
jgi:mannose-6-phosphate isomerase-like protein (cupin superfamily)